MKNVLFVAHNDAGQETRLQCALDVVRAVDGHLNCIDVAIPAVVIGGHPGHHGQFVATSDAIEAELSNRAKLESRLMVEGVSHTWAHVTGSVEDAIVIHSQFQDLVIVSSHGDMQDDPRLDVASSIVSSVGRPVLAVPHRTVELNLFGTAMIAWEGSKPAEATL